VRPAVASVPLAVVAVVLTLVAGLGVIALPAAPASATALAAPTDSCAPLDPFGATWSAWYLATVGVDVAADALDLSSGCEFHLGGRDVFPTASTVKAEILGAVLLAVQDSGAATVPPDLDALLVPMITESDNDATQQLYDWLGGGAALQAASRRLGMVEVDDVDHDWGGDATTPADEVRLLRTLLVGGGALRATSVAYARSLMTSVDPAQAWGVSAGVPDGSVVALKDGWLFDDGSDWGPANAWRVNSIGAVTLPDGRTYLLAVYGDEWATMADGIAGIETLSSRVAARLAAPRDVADPVPVLAGRPPAAFTPVGPVRLADTRSTGTRVGPGADLVVDVRRGSAVPTAVAVELTAVDPTAPGYVTAFADGGPRPLASNLNPLPGRVTANLAVVPVGADGRIRIVASTPVSLVVDLEGTWLPTTGAVAAGRFRPIAPVRVLDTRDGSPVAAASARRVAVTGIGGVPATGVLAVAVTITATDVTGDGYWTAWAGGSAPPWTSMLNTAAGDTVGNTALVPVGPDETISVYSQSGGDLVVDVVGWFTDASAPAATAGELEVLDAPVRVFDTRYGDGGVDRLVAGTSAALPVAARTGGAVPPSASGVIANLTTVTPSADGYVTVWPAGQPLPPTSTTNPSPSRDPAATALLSGLGDGTLSVHAATSVDLVVDVAGLFTP
jgi:beta-lactamase class A